MKRDLWWIALVGMAVQAFWMLRLEHPTYFDAYYYTINAQRLAAGHGFTEMVIWHYLDDPAGLPRPSFTYWMPLPSLLAAVGYFLGNSFRAAQIPFWLLAGLLPCLSYLICWQLRPSPRLARTAALLTAAGGYYTAYWVQPTTFALFAWTGGACLLALAWAAGEPHWRWWLLAGLLAGLSHMARADGLLLLPVAGLVWLGCWQLERGEEGERPFPTKILLQYGVIFAGGYLLVMGSWFWRIWQVTGRALSDVGTQTIFFTEYNELFSYGRSFTLESYLASGWNHILSTKLTALSLAAQTFIVLTGFTVFTFFLVWAWWVLGRQRESKVWLRPFTFYTLILYLSMPLIFTFPGQRGSLLHSSTALWPWAMALAAIGIDLAVDWIAARRPGWRPVQAKRFFGVTLVGLAYLLSFVVALPQPLHQEAAAVYHQIGEQLPLGTTVMTTDPAGLHYHSGLPAIMVPYEEPDLVLQAAQRYGADYLLLDGQPPPRLTNIYENPHQDSVFVHLQELTEAFQLYKLILTE
jgi:hypothetical protein